MKRITKRAWFSKKRIGWGLRASSWQGWLATLIFVLAVFLDRFYSKKGTLRIAVFVFAVTVYVTVVILTGGRLGIGGGNSENDKGE